MSQRDNSTIGASNPRVDSGIEELPRFTVFWKENACSALVRIRTLQATDLETAKEAADFLIFQGSNTVAVALGVVED
jgi:hypothetical protein